MQSFHEISFLNINGFPTYIEINLDVLSEIFMCFVSFSEARWKPNQTSKKELFAKIVRY